MGGSNGEREQAGSLEDMGKSKIEETTGRRTMNGEKMPGAID